MGASLSPFAFAGLWEWWGGPDGKEPIESCTILTSDANELASEVHNRVPVILDADDYDGGACSELSRPRMGGRHPHNNRLPAANTQLEDSMDTILISMLPLLVPLVFFLYYALHPVNCPDCGETRPLFYSTFKKTRRMWLSGGYLCARCGCKTNVAGQKVTADTPCAPFPTLQCVSPAVLLLIGVGLGA